MSDICQESEGVDPLGFCRQLVEAELLTSREHRQQRALAMAKKMLATSEDTFFFGLDYPVPFGTTDGCIQGAYLSGSPYGVWWDQSANLYFIGTNRPTLGLEEFEWQDAVDSLGRPTSGPVHGSPQFVKCSGRIELWDALKVVQRLFLAPPPTPNNEVHFGGILKIKVLEPHLLDQVRIATECLAYQPRPLKEKDLHITLIGQEHLRHLRKELKAREKGPGFPAPPPIKIEFNPPDIRVDEEKGRKSWVLWVDSDTQRHLETYLEAFCDSYSLDWESLKERRFHITVANLTGKRGDSVA
jgi:hypothetical protein